MSERQLSDVEGGRPERPSPESKTNGGRPERPSPESKTNGGRPEFPWLEAIPVAWLRLGFTVRQPVLPGPFPANRVRGSLGAYLRGLELCAALPDLDCHHCQLTDRCQWFAMFGQVDTRQLRPYALEARVPRPPAVLEPGEQVATDLLLFGALAAQPERIVAAFYQPRAGGALFGGEARLEGVRRATGPEEFVPWRVGDRVAMPLTRLMDPARLERLAKARAWRIRLRTPLTARVNQQGMVRDDRLSFADLVRLAVRRTVDLARQFGGYSAPVDFEQLARVAAWINPRQTGLGWVDFERSSRRQNTRMAMGGLMGSLEVEGPLGAYAPLFLAAEVCRLGKRTTFGFGALEVNEV